MTTSSSVTQNNPTLNQIPQTSTLQITSKVVKMTHGYQPPVMSEEELKEYNNDKLPKRLKTAPIFDIARLANLPEWLESIKNIFKLHNLQLDIVKVAKAIDTQN